MNERLTLGAADIAVAAAAGSGTAIALSTKARTWRVSVKGDDVCVSLGTATVSSAILFGGTTTYVNVPADTVFAVILATASTASVLHISPAS